MTVINHKSISGITSITAPAGSDNLFTVHTNDTTERFRIDASGHQNISGIITAANFKTGTTNVHNVGVELAGINVLGADTPIGTGATIYDAGGAVFTGVVTATSFKGSITDATGYTTINNNANNRLVTASGTANTLDAEAALTFYNSGSDPILTLSNSGHPQLTLTSTSGSDHCGVNFGDSADHNAGMIQYTNNGDYMVFHTAGTEKLRITSGGVIQCKGETDVLNNILRVTDGAPKIIMSVPSGGLDTRLFNDGSGNFIIGHGDNSDTPTERLRITSTGVINIGKGDESAAVENLVELYVGGNNGSHATIRGKYNRTNQFNRSEVRFGVQDNSAGKGFLAFATGTNSASEKVRIRPTGQVEFKNGSFSDNVNCVMASGSTLEIGATATIKLRTATNERLQIDSTGSVHVGFSGESLYFQNGFNNSNARIQNAGASNNSNLRFLTRNAGTEEERLRITETGNVGIDKTSSISARLHIGSDNNDGSLSQLIKLGNDSSGNGTGTQINMGAAHANESTAACIAGMYDGTGTAFIVKTAGTYSNQSTVGERLRINAAGQLIVGSGTNTIINAFKLAVKETAGENAAIVFLDTDNMKGGICGIAKGTDQLIAGTSNVDFIVGSSYNKTHIIAGNGSNSTGYIRATATTSGNFIVGHTADRDVGSSAFGRLQVHNNNSIVNTALAAYGNNAGGCILSLGHSRHATVGSVGVAVQNDDHLGDIRFAGDDGTDLETTACNIIGRVDGSVSGNSIPGRLEFWTSGSHRLSIDSSGHVRAGQNGLKYSTDSSGWHQLIQGGATNPGGAIKFTGGNSTGDLKFYAQGATSTLTERMRIHSDGMLEARNRGNSKTYWFSDGRTGGYSSCTIVIDAHAYHSFVIDVAFGGYAGKWATARYMGYENGSMYNGNEGTETTDSNSRNITHDQNPGGGHKHRIRIEGGIGTHPVIQLQITVGGPDAYIDTDDISYTWA